MPLPKIEKPEQVALMEGVQAKKLVRVVKLSKTEPDASLRLVEMVAKAKAEVPPKE